MKFSDWKDAAELIGIVGIVVSLLFVGLQLQQSHKIALATQYQARAEATQNLYLALIEADHLMPVPELHTALHNGLGKKFSAKDINVFLWLWIQYDNHFYQYESGFFDESAWQAQRRNIGELYSICDARFVYEWRKKGLRSEFVDLIESFEDSCAIAN